MTATKKLLVLLFVFAMVAAACGDDGDTGDTTTAAPPATTQAPGTTAPPATSGPTTTIAPPAAEIATDIGVDDDEIRIGLLADLTGVFRGLTVDIVNAQLAYWDIVNANGGIAGRQVVPVVEDTVYQVDTHEEKYKKIVDNVVAFSNSTGSPHTAGILDDMVADKVMAIPLSWYSGWADPEFDNGLTFEQGTNYCLEGMNMVEYVGGVTADEKGSAPTVAIVTRPGDYGEDGGAGATYAANQLGYEIVYNGIGDIVRDSAGNFDPTTIVTNIVGSQPDIVFVTGSPSELGPIMGGTISQGLTPQWTGSGPSYDYRLLDNPDLAPALSAFYWVSDYYTQWGTDVPGMNDVVAGLTAAYPDSRPSNAYIIGWTEARQMEQILRLAAANGDLTRQGVIDAANSIEIITLDGAGPDLTYVGTPNDYVIRSTNIFKPNADRYAAAGGADQKLSDGIGTTGADPVELDYTGSLAGGFQFDGACWTEADGDRINS